MGEDDALAEPSAKAKGKRKAADSDTESEDSDEEEEEDKKIPKTPAGHEWKMKSKALFARRREVVLLKHQAELLLGDVSFVLQDSANEKKYYDAAEVTRASFLRGRPFNRSTLACQRSISLRNRCRQIHGEPTTGYDQIGREG